MDRGSEERQSVADGRSGMERSATIEDTNDDGEEWVDEVDERNQVVGRVTRKRAVEEGLHHRAVYVWLCSKGGELLLQRRARSKRIGGGQWDISVAEHLLPGETYREAARRGLAEELNISDIDLSEHPFLEPHYRRLSFPLSNAVESEFVASFIVDRWSAEDLHVDPVEVAEVRWWRPEEVCLRVDSFYCRAFPRLCCCVRCWVSCTLLADRGWRSTWVGYRTS